MGRVIFLVFLIILIAGELWLYSRTTATDPRSSVIESVKDAPNTAATDENPINIRVENETITLGSALTISWDVEKVPPTAHGIGIHIVRPDHNYISGTGIVGIDPSTGSVILPNIPDRPFYGFVEGGDYYVSVLVTDTRDPNGEILMHARSELFTILEN